MPHTVKVVDGKPTITDSWVEDKNKKRINQGASVTHDGQTATVLQTVLGGPVPEVDDRDDAETLVLRYENGRERRVRSDACELV